jgi:hypothetical protein
METRQSPRPDGTPRSPTLIATTRQEFAAALESDIELNNVHMWDMLDNECYKLADDAEAEDMTERLVNGEIDMKTNVGGEACLFSLR